MYLKSPLILCNLWVSKKKVFFFFLNKKLYWSLWMCYWWGKEWWWWCGFSLISLFFHFSLMDLVFLVLVCVVWVLISLLFGFWFLCCLDSNLKSLDDSDLLNWWPVPLGSNLIFSRLRVHFLFTWFNRISCGSTPNLTWPNLWTALPRWKVDISFLGMYIFWSPIFFQKYWDIVGVSVSNCELQALNTGVMPRGINNIYICLIPKIKNPLKDYGLSPN